MADRPILFSAPMVRAILDGRKTQTRRVPEIRWYDGANQNFTGWRPEKARPNHWFLSGGISVGAEIRVPYNRGDRLYVREHWRTVTSLDDYSPKQMADLAYEAGYLRPWTPIRYEADGATENLESCDAIGRHRQGMHMPRWASRLTLLVTAVRVQRLQDISEEDARAEGMEPRGISKALDRGEPPETWWFGTENGRASAKSAFRDLWDHLNAKRGFGWDANPWVCAVAFTAHQCNIDLMEGA